MVWYETLLRRICRQQLKKPATIWAVKCTDHRHKCMRSKDGRHWDLCKAQALRVSHLRLMLLLPQAPTAAALMTERPRRL